MKITPCTLGEARRFVADHHRHHQAPQGGLFACAVSVESEVVGVAIAGRPVARNAADGWTVEVTRCCVIEEHPNACSMLYAAIWRAAKALGYRRAITYTLDTEPGTSLKAAGWRVVGSTKAGDSWNRTSRPRIDKHPLQSKIKFEVAL